MLGDVFGSLTTGYARNLPLKQRLFSYIVLDFTLSEAKGLFCLLSDGFSHPLCHGEDWSLPPVGLSSESPLPRTLLFLYLPRQLEESGWLRISQRADK